MNILQREISPSKKYFYHNTLLADGQVVVMKIPAETHFAVVRLQEDQPDDQERTVEVKRVDGVHFAVWQ